MFQRVLARSLVLTLVWVSSVFGAEDVPYVPIPRDQNLTAPAVDLIYQGTRIGRDQAASLRMKGVDLSSLDPEMNDLWQSQPLPMMADPAEYPAEGATVNFGYLKDASLFYRAQVTDERGHSYFLIIDLNNHRSLVTAALMRRLGYQVPAPKFFRRLKLRFATLAQYESFMGHEKQGEGDVASPSDIANIMGRTPDRWVVSADKQNLEIILQDVNLETARVTVPQYYQGSVDAAWIQGRRAARGAIVPLSLLNFNLYLESINIFGWEGGRISADNVLLFHASAKAFDGTGFDDARWIMKKLALLNRQDWMEVLRAAQLPDDVTALVLEKVISRRDHLIELFSLKSSLPPHLQALKANVKLNVGHVKNGEVTREYYEGYAARFTVGDPSSPLRWSELKHYLRMEAIGQALSAGTSKLNGLLQFKTASDQGTAHLEKVFNEAVDWMVKNPGQPYVVPVKAWAKPIYGMNVNATRNVVTGTYYGSDSKVQLVDNFSVGGSVGAFGSIDGKKWAFDAASGYKFVPSASVSYVRTYTHVRPLPTLAASKEEKWKRLAVPLFMRSLGKIVDPSTISKGDPAVKAALKEFLSDIREGEVFTITDSYVLRGGPNYTIPLTALMGPGLTKAAPSVGVALTGDFAILKRVMITRRNGNIEVYDTKMNTRGIGATLNVNFWINIARAGWQKKKGEAETDAMLIDLSPVTIDDLEENKPSNPNGTASGTEEAPRKPPIDPEKVARDRVGLLKTLNILFRQNETDAIRRYIPVHHLEHEMKSRLINAKVLLWSWNSFQSDHRVKITPPADPERKFDPKDFTRTLYSARNVDLRGKDPYGFFGQIVAKASKLSGVFATDGNLNPSGTFMGKATWTAVQTEAETTNDETYAPAVTIDDYHSGWNLSKANLFKILDAIDQEVGSLNQNASLFRKGAFASTEKLQAYEIHSTVLIFPGGVKRLEDLLFNARTRQERLIRLMDLSETRNLRERCQGYLSKRNLEAELEILEGLPEDSRLWNRCIEPWMRRVMKTVRKAPARSAKEAYVRWMNQTVHFLQRRASLPKMLKRIGTDEFLFRVQVNGFRTKDENGDMVYVADTIGSIPSGAKKSPFHDLEVYSNGRGWTLSDYETNARYFGSGL